MTSKPRKNSTGSPAGPPPTTEEAQDSHMIALAVQLVEKQLRDGTASAQVISHYLKMGNPKEQLERQKLHYENQLLQARTKQIGEQEELTRIYSEALRAMGRYQGHEPDTINEGFNDEY